MTQAPTNPPVGPRDGAAARAPTRAGRWRLVRAVALCELRRLVRDRKALFLALVLPMALYPLMFWGSRELGRVGERQMAAQALKGAIDISALDPELGSAVLERLAGEAQKLDWETVEFGPKRRPGERAERAGELLGPVGEDRLRDVVVLGIQGGLGARIELYYRGTNERGQEASKRVSNSLRALADGLLAAGLDATLGSDPAETFVPEVLDLAPARDRAGASLGRLLPLILALVLLSGGAFAALDAFAAERELGTLETLLVQPVPSEWVATGKFLAVLATALVTWLGNAASLLLCAVLGLFSPDDLTGHGAASAGLIAGLDLTLVGRVILGSLLFLPTAALLAAVLCLISARAKSFRDGQQRLFPLTMLVLVLSAPSALPTTELSLLLGALPLVGPGLAMRDALVGRLSLGMGLWVVLTSLLPLWLALRQIGQTLDAERLLREDKPKGELGQAARIARRGLHFAVAASVGLWLVGGSWTATHGVPGRLAAMAVAAGLALLLAGLDGDSQPGSLARELGLRVRPQAKSLAWALVGAVLLATFSTALEGFGAALISSDLFSGGRRALDAALVDRSLGLRLLVLCIAPALALEAFYRGALQSALLRRNGREAWILPALLFALLEAGFLGPLNALALGALAGLARWRGGGLAAAAGLHLGARGLPLVAPGLAAAVEGLPTWSAPLALAAWLAIGWWGLKDSVNRTGSPPRPR